MFSRILTRAYTHVLGSLRSQNNLNRKQPVYSAPRFRSSQWERPKYRLAQPPPPPPANYNRLRWKDRFSFLRLATNQSMRSDRSLRQSPSFELQPANQSARLVTSPRAAHKSVCSGETSTEQSEPWKGFTYSNTELVLIIAVFAVDCERLIKFFVTFTKCLMIFNDKALINI